MAELACSFSSCDEVNTMTQRKYSAPVHGVSTTLHYRLNLEDRFTLANGQLIHLMCLIIYFSVSLSHLRSTVSFETKSAIV